MFSVNLHEFKPIQALDCINLNMIIHKYELLPGLIGADILNKTCVIGLSYLDSNNQLLKQSLFAGTVVATDKDDGITIKLFAAEQNTEQKTSPKKEQSKKSPNFILPSSLPWFNAPKGIYRDENNNVLIENPNYLVTWDIQRTQESTKEKDHEWWNWIPRTTPPSVGSKD